MQSKIACVDMTTNAMMASFPVITWLRCVTKDLAEFLFTCHFCHSYIHKQVLVYLVHHGVQNSAGLVNSFTQSCKPSQSSAAEIGSHGWTNDRRAKAAHCTPRSSSLSTGAAGADAVTLAGWAFFFMRCFLLCALLAAQACSCHLLRLVKLRKAGCCACDPKA